MTTVSPSWLTTTSGRSAPRRVMKPGTPAVIASWPPGTWPGPGAQPAAGQRLLPRGELHVEVGVDRAYFHRALDLIALRRLGAAELLRRDGGRLPARLLERPTLRLDGERRPGEHVVAEVDHRLVHQRLERRVEDRLRVVRARCCGRGRAGRGRLRLRRTAGIVAAAARQRGQQSQHRQPLPPHGSTVRRRRSARRGTLELLGCDGAINDSCGHLPERDAVATAVPAHETERLVHADVGQGQGGPPWPAR